MKSITFFFFTSFSYLLAHGQETTNNFRLENREIVWQKVYQTNLTQKEILTWIESNGVFKNTVNDSLQTTGELREIDANFKGAGYSEMLTPIYISRSHINAFALFEFKENRYRVTIKKIVFVQAYDDPLSKQGEKSSIELYAIKNDRFTNSFKKSPSSILNFTFNKLFEMKAEPSKSNW